MIKHTLAAGLLATALLILAACGGSGHNSNATQDPSSVDGDQAMLDWTHCMRAHGAQVADPVHRPGHAGLSIALPSMTPTVTAARQACDPLLANIDAQKKAGQTQLLDQQHLDALLAYARCMRNHDIPLLDPNATGQLQMGSVPGLNNTVGRGDPAFHDADAACRSVLPADVHDDGTGP